MIARIIIAAIVIAAAPASAPAPDGQALSAWEAASHALDDVDAKKAQVYAGQEAVPGPMMIGGCI